MNDSQNPPTCDTALIQQACNGEDRAFAELINRHRVFVFNAVYAVLKNATDAEDATQEAFVLAYRRLDQLKEVEKFSSWLYAIARNTAFKWFRKRTLETRGLSRLQIHPDLIHPEKTFESRHSQTLKQAFDVLTPEDRKVTTLFYMIGLDQEHIASMLNIPVGTVKSRLHRSRKQLKRRLEIMAKETKNPCQDDYGRSIIGGMRGVIHWQKLIQKDGLEDFRSRKGEEVQKVWTRTDNAIIGSTGQSDDTPPLIIGDPSWRSYELSLLITPISGGNAQVFFRMSEDTRNWYLLDFLTGWQAIAISKVTPEGLTKLSVVNFPIEHGHEYDVQIAAREASLTSYIDGKLVNQVTDFSYPSGVIALNVWQSKIAFRDLRFRLLH